MEDLSLKEKLLKSLFESSKTTGELLVSLRYGKTKYNAIDKDLKALVEEGLIGKEKTKIEGRRGQPPTVYSVVCELPTLQKILQKIKDEPSSLRSAMQKNDAVLSLLAENQFWRIDYEKARQESEWNPFDCDKCLRDSHEPSPCGGDEQQRQSCLKFQKENPEYIVHTPPELEELVTEEFQKKGREERQDRLTLEFKNRLRLSPHFFKACLTSTREELEKQLEEIYGLTLDAHLGKHPLDIFSLGNEPEAILRAKFDKVFEISVYHDILNKESSKEAEDYILEMNKRKANVLEDIERLDRRTYYEEPDLLKFRYEEESRTPKPLKSVKFEIDFKKIKQNEKLKNMSELNSFLIGNQFSAEEIALSQLLVGGLFQGIKRMRLKDIISGLKEKGVTYSVPFVLNTLEKLTKTKRQDGGTNPVMSTIDGINWWSILNV